MTLCRFDYVVQAMEALQVYMDTCGREKNTEALIATVHEAVHELEAIELRIKSQKGSKKAKPMESAFAEFDARLAKFDPPMAEIAAFLEKNRELFGKMERSLELLKKTVQGYETASRTLVVMQRIKKQLETRALKVRNPARGEVNGAVRPRKKEKKPCNR